MSTTIKSESGRTITTSDVHGLLGIIVRDEWGRESRAICLNRDAALQLQQAIAVWANEKKAIETDDGKLSAENFVTRISGK